MRGARSPWRLLGTVGFALVASATAPAGAFAAPGPGYEAGIAALRAERWAEAAAEFGRAAEGRPDHADTWFRLGMARSGLEDWDGAAEAYRRAIELAPDRAQAWNNLGNVAYRQGDLEAAAGAYGRAVAIDPTYQLAVYHHGWMLRQLNRPEEAAAAFRRCMDLPTTDNRERKTRADCLFYLGTLRFRDGKWADAAAMMESVVGVEPDRAEARYYLGMAYRRLDRDVEAREQLAVHKQLLEAERSAGVIRRRDGP